MKCQHFLQKHCVSCDLLSHDYSSSIAIKEQKLAQLFPDHTNKIKPSHVCHTGTDGTRNKAKLAVALIQNKIEFGFYDQRMQFKKLEDCPLHSPNINTVLDPIKQQLHTHQVIPYDLCSKKGELKYVLITFSESTNELLIRFVLRSKASLSEFKKITENLISNHPQIKVITANIQSTHQAILEGDEEIVLTEKDYIKHRFGDYFLLQGARSFFQTHSNMALQLYQQFQTELSQLSIHSFLDLYCGVGAFSFFARKYCEHVTGIEISDAAIAYANQACGMNHAEDIRFLAMDVDFFLQNQPTTHFDAIMVNPPRRGLNESIISHLMRLAPDYLFYSSCNADTLQRDILQLKTQYQIQSLQIFDMFPFTSHFETLTVLKKQ